jgi:putative nucleotide binding protein
MMRHQNRETGIPTRKQEVYEDYAYVLAFFPRANSKVIARKTGFIVEALGERYFKLLELLAFDNATFTLGERIYIGKPDSRGKIISVLGRLTYDMLSPDSKDEIPRIIEKIVKNNEKYFVNYFNTLQPINPRVHALELLPGVGRKYRDIILREREKKAFESLEELEKRCGLNDPLKIITKRVLDELTGQTRYNIFVRRE